MNPVETQKIIWTKGTNEITMEEMYRNGNKFDLICNGDRRLLHVCIQDKSQLLTFNWKCMDGVKKFLEIINTKG